MRKQVQLAARIDHRLKTALEEVCKARGFKMNRFVAEALIDKLEELEDSEDIKRLRFEPTRPLADVIRSLGLDGEV